MSLVSSFFRGHGVELTRQTQTLYWVQKSRSHRPLRNRTDTLVIVTVSTAKRHVGGWTTSNLLLDVQNIHTYTSN